MVNTCTCLLAAILVFSILGYMAHIQVPHHPDKQRPLQLVLCFLFYGSFLYSHFPILCLCNIFLPQLSNPPTVFGPHSTENSKHIFPKMKLRGLVPSFYIHVSGINLYIPTTGLILNLYFPVLLQRTLGSTTGADRRAGNCGKQGLAAVPCPPLRSSN